MIHHKPDQQLCEDDKLIAVLRDGEDAAQHQEVVEHIEQCSRCQQRFDELAAGAQDWTKARQALLNDDPCSENRVGSVKWDYSLRNEGPVAWTESMASQLLSPASHPELLGRIGRYDVERLIGSGGMGVVFKAHDSELNRPVAIKILAPYLSSSGPARKRFAREARAAAAVVHEHVVPIYNVETEREIPFLVMHFIAGESLQGRIDREGALELCEILRIGMQVASGLSAAHQQGLVHRDIKPSNILMDQGVERALITDFGLAGAADDASLTRTGFHPGTPQYMSPEQAAGEQVDARSDLFSLGSLLYTMCAGRPPFRAETSLGVLRRITDVEPRPIREINPNIPEWLCLLISRLMAKSRDDRFGNALEVADLLGRCLAHVQQPTSAPLPASLVPQATTGGSVFSLTRLGVMTMLGTIGMTLLGMVLWQANEPPENSIQQSTNSEEPAAAESPDFNGQQTTIRVEATPAPVISNVTIADKTATVSGIGGNDLDCVLRIGKSKKNVQVEWTTPVTGQFTATITASDRMPSGNGKLTKGVVLTVQNATSSNISNIGMSDGDPVPAGEVRFRQQSAMDRADSVWTFADIYCDDGTTIPISIFLRANKPLLPPGPLVYEGMVQEWVGGDRDGLTLPISNYKPVPSATLQLYKVSPIITGGSGYQFEEIAVFETDKEGHFKISIPDDLKRFIRTPHTKEWDEWESLLLITTSGPGFATNSMTLAADRGLPFIELTRGTSISGRLVDENGKPVIGAQVTVNNQSRSSVEEMDEWLRKTSSEPLPAAKFDPADTPAILAARTPASIANHRLYWIPTLIEGVVTDPDGRFTIDGIGPDDVLDLTVEALSYNDTRIKVIGRDIKAVYSRDPFGSGDNIAVHGRNFQVSLAASDRGSLHTRHRIIKGERTKGNMVAKPSDVSTKEEPSDSIQKPAAIEPDLQIEAIVPDPTIESGKIGLDRPIALDSKSSVETRDQDSSLVDLASTKAELPSMASVANDNEPTMSLEAIYKSVRPKIVCVDWGSNGGQNASHNGTIISPEGHVLVFENVVHGFGVKAVYVTLDSGRRLPARRLGWSSQWCVGLLKIESNETFPFARMSTGLSEDESSLLAIGFPYRPYRKVLEPDIRSGTIVERFGSKCFRATNRLREGCGTGIFNSHGQFVGICTHSSSSGFYCTSSTQIAGLWDELIDTSNVDEKRLFDQTFDLSNYGRSTNNNEIDQANRHLDSIAATIRLREKSSKYGWSGVVVTTDGIVVTCAHHACRPGTEIVAEFPDGRDFPARVLGMNPVTDIGLVQILHDKSQLLPCVKIGRSTMLRGGESVTALGFPAVHKTRLPLEESAHIIAHGTAGHTFIANDKKTKWICAEFTKQGQVGQSGSGLFNVSGELIGIMIIGENPRHYVRIEAVLDQWQWLTSDDAFKLNIKPNSSIYSKFLASSSRVQSSVVEILCDRKRSSTGVIVGSDGRILAKLSELHGEILCRASDGREFIGAIINSSRENDLALIQVDSKTPLTALPLGPHTVDRFSHIAAILPPSKRPWTKGFPPMDDNPIIGIVTKASQRISPIAGSLGLFSDDPLGVRLTGLALRDVGLQLNDVVLSINGRPTPNLEVLNGVLYPTPDSVIGYAGDKVSVKFTRGREKIERDCVLSESHHESLDEESPRRSGFSLAYDSDLEIYQAECGAPIIDADGNWIGIAIATRGSGYVYVLSSSEIQAFLSQSN